ncbi:uncharacterized protein [Rutidosis leptorrhynchoides]|uniref:uncharacterized protein n=1 Tax=Rutidosis leptorrhynchoides TaxID=125765 RepID=UPI003A98F41F
MAALSSLLLSAYLEREKEDRWSWNLSASGKFTVKKLTEALEEKVFAVSCNGREEIIHNSLIPKKVEIFVWRTLQKRLPVRIELDKRGIDLHSVRCPSCDDDIELAVHMSIFCSHAQEIWSRIFKWWKLGNFSTFSIAELLRDPPSHVTSYTGRKFLQAVMWVSLYLIWKNRNNKVFHCKGWNAPVALNEIQVITFE